MKALRVHRWGERPALEEVPEPIPGEGEVLLDVEACGVGLTVLNCMRGDLDNDPANLPRIPGHELVGTVVEAGPGVDRRRVGETVAAYFYLFCGTCPSCIAGSEPLCRNLAGWVGVNRDGGYAERAVLPERNAVPLPRELDPVLATVIPDAVATPVHVSRLARIQPGERVAVIAGGGGVGVHMVQVAAAYGARVAGLDVQPAKLAFLADRLGVAAVDSARFDSIALPAGWGGRADVVVDLLGRAESLRWALGALDAGGRLIAMTTFRDVEFPVSPRELVSAQLSMLGSRYASRYELHLAARLVAEGRVLPVVSRRERIEGVESIHDDLRGGKLLGRGALVWG